jgi:hypothetical protein
MEVETGLFWELICSGAADFSKPQLPPKFDSLNILYWHSSETVKYNAHQIDLLGEFIH